MEISNRILIAKCGRPNVGHFKSQNIGNSLSWLELRLNDELLLEYTMPN